jgi:hypothetical protein
VIHSSIHDKKSIDFEIFEIVDDTLYFVPIFKNPYGEAAFTQYTYLISIPKGTTINNLDARSE